MANTYLFSGGSSDIALSLFKQLLQDAANDDVFLLQGHNNMDLLYSYKKELPPEIQTRVHCYKLDLRDGSARKDFIQKIASQFSVSHFVHFPASHVINKRFRDLDTTQLQQDANIQLLSAIDFCQAFLPGMVKKHRGRILFLLTSYIRGVPPKNTTDYIMVKSALHGLAKSLAIEYAAKGITVNCVAPSMVETKFLSETADLIVEMAARNNPMKRNATPEDISPAIKFLLSDDASYITGITLPITGGSII